MGEAVLFPSFQSCWQHSVLYAIGRRSSVFCKPSTKGALSSLVHGLSQHGSFPPQSEESTESPSKANVAVLCNVNPGSDILSTLPYSSGYKHYRFHPCSRGLDYTRVGVPGGGNNWE